MRDIGQLLAEHPFFAGFDADTIAMLVGCAHNVHYQPDEYLFRSNATADEFYVIRRGRVALEVTGPGREPLVIETVDAGEVVGWSWLVAPHRWFADGRAVEPTSAVALDGVCLRNKCDADPRLGYQVLQRVTHVMYQRMQATRLRLLDLYGTPSAVR